MAAAAATVPKILARAWRDRPGSAYSWSQVRLVALTEETAAYEVTGSRVIVPQPMAAPEFLDDLTRLADRAESLEAEGLARLATRSGISGLTNLKPLLHSGGVALVTITCDGK